MENEINQLLLKAPCGYSPYGVKCHFKYGTAEDVIILKCIDGDTARFNYGWHGEFHVTVEPKYIKPYLRPMSSMTEKEKKEYTQYVFNQPFLQKDEVPNLGSVPMCVDWLNAHHFDYHGLIPKGLALEAPEDMYKL